MDKQWHNYGSVSIYIEVLGNVDCFKLFESLNGNRVAVIESKAYYEAYYHVLKCLQEMKEVPFKELIVQGDQH